MGKKAWQISAEKEGCQFCGRKLPTLKNNGLTFAHIVANIPKGDDGRVKENSFLLCHTCHDLFDKVIKPKIDEARNWYLSAHSASDTDFLNSLSK